MVMMIMMFLLLMMIIDLLLWNRNLIRFHKKISYYNEKLKSRTNKKIKLVIESFSDDFENKKKSWFHFNFPLHLSFNALIYLLLHWNQLNEPLYSFDFCARLSCKIARRRRVSIERKVVRSSTQSSLATNYLGGN